MSSSFLPNSFPQTHSKYILKYRSITLDFQKFSGTFSVVWVKTVFGRIRRIYFLKNNFVVVDILLDDFIHAVFLELWQFVDRDSGIAN